MERSLVIGALENAVAASTGPLRGLFHHSDQSSQYSNHDFAAALAVLGIELSMSRRGNCYDNAAPRRRHSSLGYISPAQFELQTQSRALF